MDGSLSEQERERFDLLVEAELAALPSGILALLDEAPLIVEDEPDAELLAELAREWADADEDPEWLDDPTALCGLHTGVAMTDRGIDDSNRLPSQIHLFRRGVIAIADGWAGEDADERIAREIRVTVLHELGHEFGLDEDDLKRLGFD